MRHRRATRKGKDMKTECSIAKIANPTTMAGRFTTACATRLLPLPVVITLE
jgi:hypothetical protein